MKILFVSHYLRLDGAPIALFELIKELTSTKNIDISVLSFFDGPLKSWYERIKIYPTIKNYHETNRENIKNLSNYIKKEKFDIIVANTLDTINLCYAANIVKKPVILSAHEDWPQVNFSTLHLFAFKVSDLILFYSSSQQKTYKPILNGIKNNVVTNGISFEKFALKVTDEDTEKIKLKNNLPTDKKIISIVGTICSRKKQDVFIRAANEILKQRKDLLFLIVGLYNEKDLYYQLLRKYIKTANLEDKILFLGSKENMEEIYQISDLIVRASSNDIVPNVLIEALASKKPVVGTNINSIPKLIQNNGIIVEPNDTKQMEKAILDILNDYDSFKEEVNKNYSKLKSRYDIKTSAKEFLSFAQKVKFKEKSCEVRLSKSEVSFIAKNGLSLNYKEFTPLITRKKSSEINPDYSR